MLLVKLLFLHLFLASARTATDKTIKYGFFQMALHLFSVISSS